MKTFIISIQGWLNHRLRQLIWKRWKRVRTRYTKLRQYGIEHDEAMKIANSRDIGVFHEVKHYTEPLKKNS